MLLAYVLLAAAAAVVCSGSCAELKCPKPSGHGEQVGARPPPTCGRWNECQSPHC